MKVTLLPSVGCLIFACCVATFAQTPIPTPVPLGPEQPFPAGTRVIIRKPTGPNYRLRQPVKIGDAGRSEPRLLKSGIMAPSAEDVLAHKAFLAQKNTGLMRLLPRGAYHLKLRGDGAYYSFADLSHEYGWGSDIQLEIGLISTGFAGADFGILTNIGAVDPGSLDLNDERVLYLAAYKPPSKEKDARAEFVKAMKGFTNNGKLYARIALAEVDSTYLLRSVVYDKSDVLVAFRVTRFDSDGSVIIAWKLLKRYSTPKLSR